MKEVRGFETPQPNTEENFDGKTKEVLIERIAQLEEMNADLSGENERLREIATKDPLTEAYNRRGFKEAVSHIMPNTETGNERRGAKRNPAAVLILDIDNFKQINDTYGHDAGDEVIKQTADFLAQNSRKSDIVGRWGGEEFVIMFQNIGAKKVIEKFYSKEAGNAQINFQAVVKGKEITIALSGGVTELNQGEDLGEAVTRADAGLYLAKESGKNRIEWVKEK